MRPIRRAMLLGPLPQRSHAIVSSHGRSPSQVPSSPMYSMLVTIVSKRSFAASALLSTSTVRRAALSLLEKVLSLCFNTKAPLALSKVSVA